GTLAVLFAVLYVSLLRPPRPPLCPYTTLFRSQDTGERERVPIVHASGSSDVEDDVTGRPDRRPVGREQSGRQSCRPPRELTVGRAVELSGGADGGPFRRHGRPSYDGHQKPPPGLLGNLRPVFVGVGPAFSRV